MVWKTVKLTLVGNTFNDFLKKYILSNSSFATDLTSLESRRNQLSRSFFHGIRQPSSCLYHSLPPLCDTSVLSQLRTATRSTRPIPHNKNIVLLLTLEQPGASIDANVHYWTVSFEQLLWKKSQKIRLCLTLCSLSKNKCKNLVDPSLTPVSKCIPTTAASVN